MAITSENIKIQYTPQTPTNEYPFNVRYFEDSDVHVSIVNEGVINVLILNAVGNGFSVTSVNGSPENGAIITTTESYTTGDTINIWRKTPNTQENNWGIANTIPPETLNNSFDRQTAVSQEIEDAYSRSLICPTFDVEGINYELPIVELRKNKILQFDEYGNVDVDDNLPNIVTAFKSTSDSFGSGGTNLTRYTPTQLTTSITPKRNGSSFKINISLSASTVNWISGAMGVFLVRDGVDIGQSSAASNRQRAIGVIPLDRQDQYGIQNFSIMYIDETGSTIDTPIEFKIQVAKNDTQSIFINVSPTQGQTDSSFSATSSLVVEEIYK